MAVVAAAVWMDLLALEELAVLGVVEMVVMV
jgi:hypothetical protein